MEIQVKRGMRHRGQRVLNNDFGRGDVVLVGVWCDLRLSKKGEGGEDTYHSQTTATWIAIQ